MWMSPTGRYGYQYLSECEGLKTVHNGSLSKFSVRLSWVVSRRLAKSYIESVPTSEFGATTDVH